MGSETKLVGDLLTGGVTETKEEGPSLQQQLKGAVEDRKLLRRHCKRLEADLSALKQKYESSEATVASLKAKALERESFVESAKEAYECESRLARSRQASLSTQVEELKLSLDQTKVESEAREQALEAGHKDTLRSAQLVIAALKEEVSKLRTSLDRAEQATVAERARAEAARLSAETSTRELSESSNVSRLQAQICELEARRAEDVRLTEQRMAKELEAKTARLEELANVSSAQKRVDLTALTMQFDKREAEIVSRHAALSRDRELASDACFRAASSLARQKNQEKEDRAVSFAAAAGREEGPAPAAVVKQSRRFSPPASQRHKWRTVTLRVSFGEGPLGLNVSADKGSLRVTRVRGQALKEGAAAGDRVRALNGRALPEQASEFDFADAVAASTRPLVVDLERDVPVEETTTMTRPSQLPLEREEEQDGWTVDAVRHPCPPFGVYSPVVQHVLRQWTSDANKLQYVRLWLGVAADADDKSRTAPANFPRGLQLASLKREVLDAFLTLVVPLLRRSRGDHNVTVKTRPCFPDMADKEDEKARWDLALRVEIPEPLSTPRSQKPAGIQQRSAPASLFHKKFASLTASSTTTSRKDDDSAPGSRRGGDSNGVDDDAENEKRDKLAAQRRKAVEEKLAKMRDAAHR